jgi:hypothetical protein
VIRLAAVALAGLAGVVIGGGTAAAQAGGENFVQVRYFYPSPLEYPEPIAGLALDAVYRYVGEGLHFGLRLTEVRLYSHSLALELGGDFGMASLAYTGGPGVVAGSRRHQLISAGAWLLSAPGDGGVQPLRDATVGLALDLDDSPGAVSLIAVQAGVSGGLLDGVGWSAGYGYAQAASGGAGDTGHTIAVGVDATFDPLSVGLRGGARFGAEDPFYEAELNPSLRVGDHETISARVRIDTAPADLQSLAVASTRFDPLTLSAVFGRTSSALIWGAAGEYRFEEGWNAGLEYSGSSGESSAHAASAQIRYASREARLTVRGGVDLSDESGIWEARLNVGLSGALRFGDLTGTLRFSLAHAPAMTTGALAATAQWRVDPVTLSLDAALNLRQELSGSVTLQALVDLTSELAFNATLRYRRVLTTLPGDEYSAGAGVRWRF